MALNLIIGIQKKNWLVINATLRVTDDSKKQCNIQTEFVRAVSRVVYHFECPSVNFRSHDTSVGIATRYVLGCPGIESR